jgi:hypothetical protein
VLLEVLGQEAVGRLLEHRHFHGDIFARRAS